MTCNQPPCILIYTRIYVKRATALLGLGKCYDMAGTARKKDVNFRYPNGRPVEIQSVIIHHHQIDNSLTIHACKETCGAQCHSEESPAKLGADHLPAYSVSGRTCSLTCDGDNSIAPSTDVTSSFHGSQILLSAPLSLGRQPHFSCLFIDPPSADPLPAHACETTCQACRKETSTCQKVCKGAT